MTYITYKVHNGTHTIYRQCGIKSAIKWFRSEYPSVEIVDAFEI